MKRLVFVFCAFFVPIFAWNVSCLNETPEWMQKQISSQLGEWSIDIEDVQKSYDCIVNGFYGEFAPIALITFAAGKCKWEIPKKCKPVHIKKAKAFANAVEELHVARPLPEFTLLLSLDACFERPYHLHLSTVPVLSVSKSEKNKRVLLFPRGIFEPEHEKMHQKMADSRKPFAERKEKLLWRLKTFDRAEIEYNWRLSPVTPLLFLAKKNSERLDFGIPKSCQRFVGSRVTGHLREMYKPDLTAQEITNYQYQLAFDYRSSPCDLEEQLFCGAVILRAKTRFSEWFTERLEPYKHYIPVDERCDQIIDVMEWCATNKEQTNQIAHNAQHFADQNLNDQQMFTYFYHLICRYVERLGENND